MTGTILQTPLKLLVVVLVALLVSQQRNLVLVVLVLVILLSLILLCLLELILTIQLGLAELVEQPVVLQAGQEVTLGLTERRLVVPASEPRAVREVLQLTRQPQVVLLPAVLARPNSLVVMEEQQMELLQTVAVVEVALLDLGAMGLLVELEQP